MHKCFDFPDPVVIAWFLRSFVVKTESLLPLARSFNKDADRNGIGVKVPFP